MAITPRSFLRNPALLMIALLAASSFAYVLFAPCSKAPRHTERACATSSDTEERWVECVDRRVDLDDYQDARRMAELGLRLYPRSAQLHNLKGIAAARDGRHALAVEDFAAGLNATGSPSGTFENNIAWSKLYAIDGLDARQKVRALREIRSLYQTSFEKGLTCERVHTAMFVEYSIVQVAREQQWLGLMLQAQQKFAQHHNTYFECAERIRTGDRYVVEEVASAAIISREMKQTFSPMMLGAAQQRAAELQLVIDHEWCAQAMPVGPVATCYEEFGPGASLMSFR